MTSSYTPTSRLFYGFSTAEQSYSKTNWNLYDIDLVRQDLLNIFMTRVGERLMMPTYGCIIWNYLFEPLTDANREIIIANAISIVKTEPRVKLMSINVTNYQYGIRLDMSLQYIPYNVINSFLVDFDNRSLEL